MVITCVDFIVRPSNKPVVSLNSTALIINLAPSIKTISFGPMIGVTYNQVSGLTEPIWGFGITYNLVKLRDWR